MTTFARKLKSQGCTWALLGATAVALGTATAPPVAAEETGTQNYVQILSTQEVSYTAIVTRGTDAINTKPWGTAGFQTISSSQSYLGTEVTVTQEQVADNGVTWALISMDGQEIGWIAKTAITPGSYAESVSTKTVDYPATITRGTDAINTQPWGAKGYQTVTSSSTYYGKTVTVSQEKVMDYGVTWALISIDGKEIGWVAKNALTQGNYSQVTSTKDVDYPAKVSRVTDAINTQPWGAKGFQTISNSSYYIGKTVIVSQEKVMDYGVTWSLISLDGQELGWIAKAALTQGSYSQVTSTKDVDYPATITRADDAINTQPWGAKGYQTLGLSAIYLGKAVTVSQEKVMDYGVTWSLVSIEGKELGWIAKAALSQGNYSQVTSTKDVDYSATITRGTDAINTQPWGAKGFQTIASSATYLGKSVTVSQEKVMDYGVAWSLISIEGKELGWIAKAALTETVVEEELPVITYGEEYTSIENEVDYETTYVENAELEVGVENLVTVGQNGYETVVYKDKYVDGVFVGVVEVVRTSTAAVTEVIEVGTKIPAMTIEDLQATIDMELLNQEFLVHINAIRVNGGRNEVVYAAEYQDEADTRALEEVEQTVASFDAGTGWDIDHERPDGSAWYGVFENRDFSAGENLLGNSINYLEALTDIDEKALAYSMFKQWESSTGHRDNMMGLNYSTSTVSVQLINVDGYVYYVGSELLTSDESY